MNGHGFDCNCKQCHEEDTQLELMLQQNFYFDGNGWVGKN